MPPSLQNDLIKLASAPGMNGSVRRLADDTFDVFLPGPKGGRDGLDPLNWLDTLTAIGTSNRLALRVETDEPARRLRVTSSAGKPGAALWERDYDHPDNPELRRLYTYAEWARLVEVSRHPGRDSLADARFIGQPSLVAGDAMEVDNEDDLDPELDDPEIDEENNENDPDLSDDSDEEDDEYDDDDWEDDDDTGDEGEVDDDPEDDWSDDDDDDEWDDDDDEEFPDDRDDL